MNTFLKVILLLIATVIAVKLLPFTLTVLAFLASAMLGIIGIGVSLLAALLGSVAFLGALLSPIWVPVLAVVGIVMLCSRSRRNAVNVA